MFLESPTQRLLREKAMSSTARKKPVLPKKRKTLHKKYFPLLAVAFLLGGCQSAPKPSLTAPVIPKANATFETSGQGLSKNDAISDAMHNATVTCDNSSVQSYPVVITHDVNYNGLINEKTDAMIAKIGRVIGSIAGQSVPTTQDKSDYQASMTFKCVAK